MIWHIGNLCDQSKKVLIFSFLSLISGCQNKNENISPVIESISESVYASGVVKSRNQYQVYPASNGLIRDILVHEGDLVEKGDSLMILSNEASQWAVENARLAAQYASREANADKLRELRADIELAKTKLVNDSLLWIRQQKLWSENVGTKAELEQRELAYQNAMNSLQDANIRYLDFKRQVEFNEQQSLNNLKINASIANDFVIKSEIDGMVFSLLKEKGEFANTMNPVAIVGDADHFYAELTVDEYDITRLKTGQRVLITMDSYSGRVFEGYIDKVVPLMNEASRSFTVHANFKSIPEVLYPNLSLEANIVIRTKEKVMTIPRSYLIGDSLVVRRDGQTKKVQVGVKDYRKAEIISGLTTEDILIPPQP